MHSRLHSSIRHANRTRGNACSLQQQQQGVQCLGFKECAFSRSRSSRAAVRGFYVCFLILHMAVSYAISNRRRLLLSSSTETWRLGQDIASFDSSCVAGCTDGTQGRAYLQSLQQQQQHQEWCFEEAIFTATTAERVGVLEKPYLQQQQHLAVVFLTSVSVFQARLQVIAHSVHVSSL